jgi:hypothetical protein
MGDVSSGTASHVIQIYMKDILSCFLNADAGVRLWAMKVIELVLRQGLVPPVQIVPYLILLSTDPETEVCLFLIFFQHETRTELKFNNESFHFRLPTVPIVICKTSTNNILALST